MRRSALHSTGEAPVRVNPCFKFCRSLNADGGSEKKQSVHWHHSLQIDTLYCWEQSELLLIGVSQRRQGLLVGFSTPERDRRKAVFEASRSFLGGIRDIQKRLIFGIVDAANLHIFEEDALRLGEDHFAVLAFVDGINHGLSDFARLTARNGTV